jgi:hypothetical protein
VEKEATVALSTPAVTKPITRQRVTEVAEEESEGESQDMEEDGVNSV